MKILAGLIASCLVALPVYAQGDPPADTGKPVEAAPPSGEPPAGADAAAKPVDATTTAEPEPDEAPEGATPDKPAEPPQG